MSRPGLHSKTMRWTGLSFWPVPLLLFSLAGCYYMISLARTTGLYTDFSMLYDSAVALRRGTDLYAHPSDGTTDFNLNPPHVAALMLPLAWLSMPHAALVSWFVIVGCMAATALLLRRALPPWWIVAAMAVVLVSPAGYLSVRFINLAWPLASVITWGWLSMREGRTGRAGAALGFLVTIKLFLLVFLPYLAWKRQWRALGCAVLAAAVVVAVGATICGIAPYRTWVNQLRGVAWQAHSINVSLAGALQRNFDPRARGGFAPVVSAPIVVRPLWILLSSGLMATMYLRSLKYPNVDHEWAAMIAAALLISPLGWSYYWSLIVGPAAATFASRRFSLPDGLAIVLCAMPFLILPYGQPSRLLTVTLATTYTWGGLVLWWRLSHSR